ncbi:MAG TPA: hypothetical protein DCY25_02600 [Bacteroidales bacterium]|jgi:hypothetical protein|nr:hypothetical protein [Bacteroidales bacterium]
MSLLRTLKNGAVNAASSYKLILFIWCTTLVITLAVVYPLRTSFNMIFGNSMAVERLSNGFDIGIAGDIGKPLMALMASVSAGSLLLGTVGFFLMTFFAGGLFRRFTLAWGRLRVSDFLRASAGNFIPFLKIALLMMLIIGAYTFVLIGLPGILKMAISGSQMSSGKLMYLFYALWALGLPIWLFVADASRRWIAATGSKKTFRALGAGFRALKERFWLSYLTVLAIVLINAVSIVALFWFAASATPDKGIMVFLFFIATQSLFIIRLLMKAWRYAAVCEAIHQVKSI